jgi:hypothetical protein
MTSRQQRSFYWPAWRAVAEGQGWHSDGDLGPARLGVYGGPEVNRLYQAVWDAAARIARLAGLDSIFQDHLRYGSHGLVAPGLWDTRDFSSAHLNNKQLDRLVNGLWQLLTDPDDLDALLAWTHPEAGTRKRQEYYLAQLPGPYVAELSRDKFGTRDFLSLTNAQLTMLHMTVRNRHPLKVES